MDKVFIEIEFKTKNGVSEYFTTLESFLTLYLYKYLQNGAKLVLVKSSQLSETKGKIKLNSNALEEELKVENLIFKDKTNIAALLDLRLPVYQKDSTTFVSGMCAVCRCIVKSSSRDELLGFKESCLLAPAEASIWTRFCEVDVIQAIDCLLRKAANKETIDEVPAEVTRFEKHLDQPVRTHNIYKLAREQEKLRKTEVSVDTKTPKEHLQLEHRFAEGITFSIADLLLYACMRIIFEHCVAMESHFPLIQSWLAEVDLFEPKCAYILKNLRLPLNPVKCLPLLRIVDCATCSLYKSDPKRYKPKNRIYTEQHKIDGALQQLFSKEPVENFKSEFPNSFEDTQIDWDTVEPSHEQSSALPQQRLARKRQQLENMANAVAFISNNGDRIVDFCSGTGHLGILLGLLLPSCTIILIENKANSLERAKKRATDLKLTNIHFYQCNIDYFVGKFELGTSLHACGTATDIVLQHCRKSGAKFVCCPCCYGSLTPMPHIQYPLSKRFREALDAQNFMYIAHAADQSHEIGATNCRPETSLQGQLCMDIVDTDRKTCAEESGYKVILTRLKPEQCTPKNRLLVGWLASQDS